MDFALFVLLNAVLLVRPEELFPSVEGLRLYLFTIIACTLSAMPKLLAKMNMEKIRETPVAACVVAFLVVVIVSYLIHGLPLEAFETGSEFAKVVLYFFLFCAIVDTPSRFQTLAAWMAGFVFVLAGVGLAQYHGLTNFRGIDPVYQWYVDPETGKIGKIPRVVSTGFFNDPNDMCLALAFGVYCCLYRARIAKTYPVSVLWLLPIAYLFHVIQLTYSRGGLMGMLGGFTAWLYGVYGWKRALPLAVAVAFLTISGVGGRQAEIGNGSGHERIMLWAEGFSDMGRRPLYIPIGFGIGYYIQEYGLLAHNSFIQTYIELGLIGGGIFVAAFYTAVRLADMPGRTLPVSRGIDPEWVRLTRPFALAVVTGYAVGAYSVSRNLIIPTYLVLAYSTAFFQISSGTTPAQWVCNADYVRRMAILGVFGFVFLKFFTQFAGTAGL